MGGYCGNVIFHQSSLDEIRQRAEDVLGFKIKLRDAYKCCDLRPMFGLIFKDILGEYDYWGHCDFDMVFGDLQKYFERLDLYKYQKFLPLGHLALYKNIDQNNSRFMLDGSKFSYTEVLRTNTPLAFDEMAGIGAIMKAHCGGEFYYERPFMDISSVHFQL